MSPFAASQSLDPTRAEGGVKRFVDYQEGFDAFDATSLPRAR